MKRISLILVVLVWTNVMTAKESTYTLSSPDGRLVTHIVAENLGLTYDLEYNGELMMLPSQLGLYCPSAKREVNAMTVKRATRRTVDETITSPFTRQTTMHDHYNELTLKMHDGFSVVFRAYNEGVAYRYVWYIGGITNWTARDIEIDLQTLGIEYPHVELFRDGANAHRKGSDYCHVQLRPPVSTLTVHLAPGGGFVAKVTAD